MPLEMNNEVFMTCALTGSGGTQGPSTHVPRLPKDIADTASVAARAGASERVAYVAVCRPEICTPDCGTMNFVEADYVMTNTPGMLRAMGARVIGPGAVREKLGLEKREPV